MRSGSGRVVRNPITRAPAALPERIPAGTSSTTTQSAGSEAQRARPLDIRLWMRLAIGDVAGGDHCRWNWKSGGPNTNFRQWPSAGSNNRPSIRRQRRQQRKSAGQGNDSARVLDLLTFDLAVLGFVVRIGQKLPDRLDAGAPVRLSDCLFRLEAMLDRPLRPHARNGGGGVDEYAVQVKEHGGSGQDSHIAIITDEPRSSEKDAIDNPGKGE